jgi:hypothetical protein
VAGGFQNVVGDGNESRLALAAARPPVRNQYASTLNKEPRPRPSVERPAVGARRIMQKRAGSTMDVLLVGLIDYPCRVEAVSLDEHQSRRRGVLDRKNYFDVPYALHGWIALTSD